MTRQDAFPAILLLLCICSFTITVKADTPDEDTIKRASIQIEDPVRPS
jgi:hypothetical protein